MESTADLRTAPTPAEERLKAPPVALPVDHKGMPRGDGMVPVASVNQFQTLYNGLSRLYYAWFDEALKDNYSNAYRMTLDPMISTCLEVRADATALLTGSVEPQDDDDPAQLAAAKRVNADLQSMPGRAAYRRALLVNGVLTGLSGAEIVWNWVPVKGSLRMRPVRFAHVDGDSIAMDYSGWPSIRVMTLTVPNTTPSEWGPVYRLTPEDRECFVLFKHNPQAAQYWRAHAARSVIGSGLRNRLYWLWALKCQLWQMSLDYLAWFARGMTFLFYEYGNDAHKTAIANAMKSQDGSSAYMYPVMMTGDSKPYFEKPFEHVNVPSGNADFLIKLITSYIDDMIRFVILHQSLTTTVGSTGMGSAVAEAHETTFDNLIKLDAMQLDDCETADLVSVLYRVNEPGVPCGRYVSQVDSPNMEQILNTAKTLIEMGGSVPEKYIKDAAGIPATKEGDTVLGGIQPNQPAAVGAVPDGTPMVGADPSGQQPVS